MSDRNKKDHADFQDPYRRSSNFGHTEDDTGTDPNGDGTLRKKKEPKNGLKKIRQVVDDLSKEAREEE